MVERPPALEGGNLGLAIAVTLLLLAAGMLWIGPGRDAVGGASAELEQKAQRFANWQRRHGSLHPVSDADREAWKLRYGQVHTFGIPDGDEASLMARVAGRFSAPSVRGLEVMRDVADDADQSEAIRIRAPFGTGCVELRVVSVRVRFEARYADASEILARLGSEGSPLRIRRLDLQRRFPGVRVELDLDLWTRQELES
jgi:hypothetical protein